MANKLLNNGWMLPVVRAADLYATYPPGKNINDIAYVQGVDGSILKAFSDGLFWRNEADYQPVVTTPPVVELQLIPNWKFASNIAGWSADPSYVRRTDPAVNDGNPFIEYTGASGNFDNFTTANDAVSGIPVDASTSYVVSGMSTASMTGNYPQLQINTGADDGLGHAFPGTTLASYRFVAAASETRWSLMFTTAADTKKVWIRIQGLGGTGLFRFMKLNLTKGPTLQPYRDYFYSGV